MSSALSLFILLGLFFLVSSSTIKTVAVEKRFIPLNRYDEDQKVILCSTFNFKSDFSRSLLRDVLISESFESESVQFIELNGIDSAKIILALKDESNGFRENESNLSIVHLYHSELSKDEATVLLRLQSALKSIVSPSADPDSPRVKKPLIIIVSVPKATTASIELEFKTKAQKLVDEAWQLIPGNIGGSIDAEFEIVVHVARISQGKAGSSDEKSKAVIVSLLDKMQQSGAVNETILQTAFAPHVRPQQAVASPSSGRSYRSINVYMDAVEYAVEWARQAANASLQRYQYNINPKLLQTQKYAYTIIGCRNLNLQKYSRSLSLIWLRARLR